MLCWGWKNENCAFIYKWIYLVAFVQFKKREKQPWSSVTFSKVAGFSLQLKVTLLNGHFSRFLNCAHGTKLRNAPHICIYMTGCNHSLLNTRISFYYQLDSDRLVSFIWLEKMYALHGMKQFMMKFAYILYYLTNVNWYTLF